MMNAARIFGTLSLLYGAVLAIAAYAGRLPLFQFLQFENVTVFIFFGAGFFYLPFVITYTQLGLNSDGEPSLETKGRREQFARASPLWSITWKGALGFIGVSWVVFMFMGNTINPFFAFSASISFMSGMWFVFVYPIAKKLFG
ncbi:MAG: hypothetical protein P1V19_14465 [Gimesia sp.]|nr:hypothetical protein [Gimesia sp.]